MMRDFSFFTSLLGFGNDSLFEVLSCMRVPFEQITSCAWFWVLQVALVVKNTPADAGDPRDAGSTPGSGRSSGGGHDHLVRYSCLETLMDRGTWWAPIHGVTRSWTRQSNQAQPSMPDTKVFSPRPIPHLLPLPHSVGSRLGLLSASGLALHGWWRECKAGGGRRSTAFLSASCFTPPAAAASRAGWHLLTGGILQLAVIAAPSRFSQPVVSASPQPVRDAGVLTSEVQVTGHRSNTAPWVCVSSSGIWVTIALDSFMLLSPGS